MNEQFEILGHWWFPENPERTVLGTLSIFENDYANLEINGPLLEIDDVRRGRSSVDFEKSFKRKPIIFGVSEKGEKITLVDNIFNELFIAIADKAHISSHYVFHGAHFEERQGIRFDEMRVYFEDIEKWTIYNGLSQPISDGESITIKHTGKTIREITIEKNTKFKVVSHAKYLRDKQKATIQSQSYLSLEKENGVFNDYFNQINRLKDLLSIFMQNPVNIIGIIGIQKRENGKKKKIRIFYPNDHIQHDRRIERFITINQIKNLKRILNTWFSLNTDYQVIINLYLLNLNTPNLDERIRFLNYMRALEGYHRLTTPISTKTKKTYGNIVKTMLNNLPEKEQPRFRDILARGYEPRLKERLDDLFFEVLKNYICIIFDYTKLSLPDFIKEIKKYRNTLTHLVARNRKGDISNYRLSEINKYLHKTLTILILKTLGLDEETIYEAVKEYSF